MELLSSCWSGLSHPKADGLKLLLSRQLTLMDDKLVRGVGRRLQFLPIWKLCRAALMSLHYGSWLSPERVIQENKKETTVFYDLVSKVILCHFHKTVFVTQINPIH